MVREERRRVEEAVLALARPLAEAMGLSVLDVQYARRGGRAVLEVCVDRATARDGESGAPDAGPAAAVKAQPGVTLAECEALSRRLSVVLDVEDPVRDRYVLEVASPGLDRVLRREGEFDHFRGRRVRVRARGPLSPVGPEGSGGAGAGGGAEAAVVRGAEAGAAPAARPGGRRVVEGELLGLVDGRVRVRDDEGQVWEADLADVAHAQLVPDLR